MVKMESASLQQALISFVLMLILGATLHGVISSSIPCTTVQTTDGGCCVFPFVYNSKNFSNCTTEDSSLNHWCATTASYDRDQQWGYCLMTCATVPTEKGACCVFPFVYERTRYTECTTRHSDRPWCAISLVFTLVGRYDYCIGIPATTKPTTIPYYNVSQGSCKPSWYHIDKSCFQIVPTFDDEMDNRRRPWNKARKNCFQKGADLAVLHTKSVLKRIWSIYHYHSWNISKYSLGPLLLGSNDLYVDWKWSDGSSVNSDVWGPGEPDSNSLAKCGVLANMAKNYLHKHSLRWCGWWLAAMSCDDPKGFICETVALNNTCQGGFNFIDGHCYRIFPKARLNWVKARLNCSSNNGTLARVNTTRQREGLEALLQALNLDIAKEKLYIDLSQDLGSWKWRDGTPIKDNLWKSGYPKERKKVTCVKLDRDQPALENEPCDPSYGIQGFICQSQEG